MSKETHSDKGRDTILDVNLMAVNEKRMSFLEKMMNQRALGAKCRAVTCVTNRDLPLKMGRTRAR